MPVSDMGRNPPKYYRPWGYYQILSDMNDHKVKRIVVNQGQRLSYQRHFHRSEHWYVIQGYAEVTKNGMVYSLSPGQAIDLPVECWHRVSNQNEEILVFIEIQTGESFGENDIERVEDDYGRVEKL